MRNLMLATTILLGFAGISHAETNHISQPEINRIYHHFNNCVAANVSPNNEAVQINVAIIVEGNGSIRRADIAGDGVKLAFDPGFRDYTAQVIRAVTTQDCATVKMPDSVRGTTMRFIVQIDPPHAPAVATEEQLKSPQPQATAVDNSVQPIKQTQHDIVATKRISEPSDSVYARLHTFFSLYGYAARCNLQGYKINAEMDNALSAALLYASSRGLSERQVTSIWTSSVDDAGECSSAQDKMIRMTKLFTDLVN